MEKIDKVCGWYIPTQMNLNSNSVIYSGSWRRYVF